MFRLVKILYSGSNQPEPLRIPGVVGESYIKGQPMKLDEGRLTRVASDEFPSYMTMESKTVEEEGDTVLCYEITPNMIFDVTCYGDVIGSFFGRKVNLYSDGIQLSGVSSKAGSVATVYDPKGAKYMGDHILIRFI